MPYIDFQQLEQLEAENTSTCSFNWRSVGLSHAGKVMTLNEDAFFNSVEQGLWAVADGMGGLARGDFASGTTMDALVHFVRKDRLTHNIRDLEMRLRSAHENCRMSFRGERVGSTVAALLSHGQRAFLLWAGDSRVYRLRDGLLEQMTNDHTVAQEKCARGELNPAQADRHPSAHILTRAVGVHQTLHLELDYHTVKQADRYLICSDGLYNPLDSADLATHLAHNNLETAVNDLVNQALQRGGDDNITAVVVEAQ